MCNVRRIAVVAGGGSLGLHAMDSALSPGDKCEAGKNKIAGKYAFYRQKTEAKAVKRDYPSVAACDCGGDVTNTPRLLALVPAASVADAGWFVFFGNGHVASDTKNSSGRVRAFRGGL